MVQNNTRRGESMKLEKWALISEVAGSAAVVATLIVLIFEVRANTELSRVTAYAAVTRDFDEFRMFNSSEPDSLDTFLRFQEGSLPDVSEEPKEALRSTLVVLTEFSQMERAYLAHQAGIFGENEWNRVHRSECAEWGLLRKSPQYYSRVAFRLTDSYVHHLDATCTPDFVEELDKQFRGESAK